MKITPDQTTFRPKHRTRNSLVRETGSQESIPWMNNRALVPDNRLVRADGNAG